MTTPSLFAKTAYNFIFTKGQKVPEINSLITDFLGITKENEKEKFDKCVEEMKNEYYKRDGSYLLTSLSYWDDEIEKWQKLFLGILKNKEMWGYEKNRILLLN